MLRRTARSTLFPDTTLFRSGVGVVRCIHAVVAAAQGHDGAGRGRGVAPIDRGHEVARGGLDADSRRVGEGGDAADGADARALQLDRKSVVWGKSVDLGGRRVIKKKR